MTPLILGQSFVLFVHDKIIIYRPIPVHLESDYRRNRSRKAVFESENFNAQYRSGDRNIHRTAEHSGEACGQQCIIIAGIQMHVVRGCDNTDGMLKKLNTVAALFPWVDIICFSELCMSGLDMNLAMPIPNPSLDRIIGWAQNNKKWIISPAAVE